MGQRSHITQRFCCEKPTNLSNPLCRIIQFKYPKRVKVLTERFEAYTGLQLHPDNLNVENLTRFRKFILLDVSINAAATYCEYLSTCIRIYCEDNGLRYAKLCETLNVKNERGIFTSVNAEEMLLVEDFYRSSTCTMDRAVAALAILEFYTGARNSDTDGFTSANIVSGTYIDKATGETVRRLVIAYSSEKTKIKAHIPVKPIVQEILSDLTLSTVVITNSVFNRRIKGIFQRLGLEREVFEHRASRDISRPLWQAVTTHSFRRSFATVLNDKGVDIEMISRMMGHTNTQQTRGYICGQNLVLDSEAMSFFD